MIKHFFFNGKQYCINKTIKLIDLIKYFDIQDSLIIIEYNGSICQKKNWNIYNINNNDKIEIITIVGGG